MVSIMDERARAIFEEARETLARVADVEYRFHDDDGMLSPWSRGMPKKPAPPPPLAVADVERKIADALPGVAAVIHMVRTALRREFVDEIAKVKSETIYIARHYWPRSKSCNVESAVIALPR